MTAPDVNALIGEVAARHGVMLRPDDPAFALVTVNQLILQQTMTELVERARGAAAQFDHAAEKAQLRAGALLAEEVRKAGTEIRQGIRRDLAETQARMEHWRFVRNRSIAIGVTSGLALFAMGIWVGWGMR